MDIEKPPHRTISTPTTSELFICFTSRLSNSSSMRLSSKSILSPGRPADKSSTLSLPTSLSRRLRHNGSLRGGQSPAMFSSKKNRASGGFDNPEPSSPKVTCIGQVRVKTKKQGKKMKMRACRSKRLSSSGGEASFRRIEHATSHDGLLSHQNSQGILNQQQQQEDCNLPHRNQRWVHLPLTICEALRTFGAEFSCLLPCKSSCFSSCNSNSEREKGEHDRGNNSSTTSCGTMFRWLVAMQEGDEGKERDIELVVDEREVARERVVVMERECSRRRSIFDDMEFNDEMFDENNNGDEKEDEEGGGSRRVSICVPPKNALLLMRCRSDPAKMSALSHKIWDASPLDNKENFEHEDDEDGDEDGIEDEDEDEEKGCVKEKCEKEVEEKKEEVVSSEEGREKLEGGFEEMDEMCEDLGMVEENVENHEMGVEDLAVLAEGEEQKTEEKEEETEEKQSIENRGETEEQIEESVIIAPNTEGEGETKLMEDEDNQQNVCQIEEVLVEEKLQDEENQQPNEHGLVKSAETEERESSDLSSESSSSISSSSSLGEEESTAESQEIQGQEDQKMNKSIEEEQEQVQQQEEQGELTLTHQRSDPISSTQIDPRPEHQDQEVNKPSPLPDCLLLMMCEPKLSMEVSKETWVCSTDFIRWLPERHASKKPNKTDGPDEAKKKKKALPAQPVRLASQPVQDPVQPARSSISFPAGGGPVANLIEQKVVKAGKGYEPFVLTRCKSAPMRSTAKIAPPEMACSLWGRENSRKMEPHRPAAYGVGAAGVGF